MEKELPQNSKACVDWRSRWWSHHPLAVEVSLFPCCGLAWPRFHFPKPHAHLPSLRTKQVQQMIRFWTVSAFTARSPDMRVKHPRPVLVQKWQTSSAFLTSESWNTSLEDIWVDWPEAFFDSFQINLQRCSTSSFYFNQFTLFSQYIFTVIMKGKK